MKNILIIVLLFTFILSAENPNGREVADKGKQVTKIAGTEALQTLIIRDDKGRERVRKLAGVTKLYDNGDTEKKLMRFLSPADVKGTGLLTYDYEKEDDDMWLYMPSLRKTRRIVSSEKAKNFMGSEFSYADMTPPNLDDFNFQFISEEKIGDENCYKIEMTPINDDIADENGFSKKYSWFSTSDGVIRKSEYYNFDDELEKILTVTSIKKVDEKNNKYRPTKLFIKNLLNGRESEMIIEKIVLNNSLPDDYFTTIYLERE